MAIVGLMALGIPACGAAPTTAGQHHPDAVTTTASPETTPPPTTTTLAPRTPRACPPGCSLPSDHDAITVLASSASLVVIITVKEIHASVSGASPTAVYTTDRVLQALPQIPYGTSPFVPDNAPMVLGSGALVVGMSYLAFVSFNRGGDCLSALFSYVAATQIATLVGSDAEPDAPRLPLPGRIVVIPQTITLADVQARMYATGGAVYPTDVGESWCPGP